MKKIFSCIIGLVFSFNICHSQVLNKGYSFNDKSKESIIIPFEMILNLVIIELKINDSDPLSFILDSGLSTMLITELGPNDSLQLNFAKEMNLKGLGEGEAIKALHSYGNTIRLKGITGSNQDIFLTLENEFNLSEKLGRRIHGIIGYDVFNNFIITIDYEKELLFFYTKESFNPELHAKSSLELPIEVIDFKSYIHSTIEQYNGKKVNVRLLIDTGASHSLWLDVHHNNKINIPDRNIYSYLGTGLSGNIFGYYGRIQGMKLGTYNLAEVVVAYPDSASIYHANNLHIRNGSVGANVFRRFRLTVDYPNERIFLKPNKHFKSPFDYNIVGIEISAPFEGINYYIVTHVRKDSPAQKAGIMIDDELIKVGYSYVRELEVNEMAEILNNKRGKNVPFIVKRNGEKIKIKLNLTPEI